MGEGKRKALTRYFWPAALCTYRLQWPAAAKSCQNQSSGAEGKGNMWQATSTAYRQPFCGQQLQLQEPSWGMSFQDSPPWTQDHHALLIPWWLTQIICPSLAMWEKQICLCWSGYVHVY